MNVEKCIAGTFAGVASLVLIYSGYITEGAMIATAMLGFFIGDANGRKAVAS